MHQQNEILIHILEHLGLSLMKAVSALQAEGVVKDVESEAQAMAKLLGASVQLGMSYSSKLNVSSDPEKAEALRFKLTAVSARALMNWVVSNKKEPTDADIEKLKTSSDSLLAFAQNFSLDDKSMEYLKAADIDQILGKEFPQLIEVDAMLPVMQAVQSNPLDKDEGKLIQSIAEKLREDTKKTIEALQKEPNDLLVQQKIFCFLANAFTAIYQDHAVKNETMLKIWAAYDRQKDMALTLLDYLITGKKQATSTSQTPQPEVSAPVEQTPVTPSAPAEPAATGDKPSIFAKKPEASQEAVQPAVTTPAAAEQPASPPPAVGDNPLALFKKPKEEGEQAAS